MLQPHRPNQPLHLIAYMSVAGQSGDCQVAFTDEINFREFKDGDEVSFQIVSPFHNDEDREWLNDVSSLDKTRFVFAYAQCRHEIYGTVRPFPLPPKGSQMGHPRGRWFVQGEYKLLFKASGVP